MKEIKPLTTGEIAEYCRVNQLTVIRWIARGELKAFKLPGRGDNRVEVADFVEFLKKHDMPIPLELKPKANRILITDDDKNLALSMQRILKKAGYETEVAFDGFSAGALITSFHPDLMTVDLQMPAIPGQDVIRFLKTSPNFSNIKILVVSGLGLKELNHAKEIGADDVLGKPYTEKGLLEKVKQLIN